MAITDKQLAALKDKNNTIIIPTSSLENQLARDFLQANAPEALEQERVFDEIYLSSLHGQMKVVCLFHNPRKPLRKWIRSNDGQMLDEARPEKELMDEMCVSSAFEPTFTREGPNKPPKLNSAGFLEKVSSELVQRYGLRMDFVDKGNQQPQILQLSWT